MLPNIIEFRHLRYFLAVAEELHFGRAAERLGISQPPLSVAIRQLEQAMGVDLLERNRIKTGLTPAGRDFFIQARMIVGELGRAVTQARRVAGGEVGNIRVSYTDEFEQGVVAGAVGRFGLSRPEILIELTHATSEAAERDVLSGALDAAFVNLPVVGVSPLLDIAPLRRARFVLAVRSDSPLAAQPELQMADLCDSCILGVNFTPTRGLEWKLLSLLDKISPPPKFRFNSTGTTMMLIGLVRAGQGITILVEGAFEPESPGISFIPISDPEAYVEQAIIYRKDSGVVTKAFVTETADYN